MLKVNYDKKVESESNQPKEPLEALKEMQIKEQEEILSLLREKQKISERAVIPYKKFNFFEKHILKRKQYKEYIKDRQNVIEANKSEEKKKRLQEIDRILLSKGTVSLSSVETKISEIKEANSLEELGIQDTNQAIELLTANGIEFKFKNCQQAFEWASEIFSKDKEFMKKAIKENVDFIKYDKTNDEELYKEVIELKIKEFQGKEISDDSLKKLYALKEELESPKQVKEGKYKVPHKFMFEEIRNDAGYFYSEVDGVYDKEFGEELEKLYENPELLVGVHGLREDKEIEQAILTKGLKNSMQSADVALNRTVAFGKSLAFTKLLNYRIPYNGLESEAAVILALPKNVLDKENPVAIWGSHKRDGSDNYILPQYIYGLYHSKSDGENRKIIKSSHKQEEKYEYLKYDYNSSRAGSVEINEKEQNCHEI